jgi:hypothetical protein
MAWSKPPQALVELFIESLPDGPGVARGKMFGLPVASVNGVVFAGVFQDSVFARLPPELFERFQREHAARPFEPMAGRQSKAQLILPDDVVADEAELAAALHAAFLHTASLPPKIKKPRASKPAKT